MAAWPHGRMAAWRGQQLEHDDYIAYIDYMLRGQRGPAASAARR